MACLRVASKQISPTGVRYEVEGGGSVTSTLHTLLQQQPHLTGVSL